MSSNKIILLIVVALIFGEAKSQNIICELASRSFSTKYFKSEFLICEMDSIVLIYDKNNTLNECTEFVECLKKIKINKDTINNLFPGKYSVHRPINLIILYDYTENKNIYKISFWRPYTGANLVLTFKKRKKKIKLIKHIIGTF